MINQFFADLTARIKASIRAAVMEAALLGAAAIFGLLVVVLLLMAAYDALVLLVAPHYAALILAGVFLVLCLTCVLSSGVLSASKPEVSKPAKPAATSPVPGVKLQIETIASSLASHGFRREGALLQAAAAASKGVKPIQLLALSLLGGFILGRRFEKK